MYVHHVNDLHLLQSPTFEPMQVAIALTLLALSMLMLWEENYGYGDEGQSTAGRGASDTAAKDGNGVMLGRKEAPASTTADAAVSNGGGGTCDTAATAAAVGGASAAGVVPASSGNGAEAHGNGAGSSSNGGLCCNGDGGGGCVGGGGGGGAPGLRKSVSMAWGCIVSDHRVLLLGMVQSLFEGGTFTFGENAGCRGRMFLTFSTLSFRKSGA